MTAMMLSIENTRLKHSARWIASVKSVRSGPGPERSARPGLYLDNQLGNGGVGPAWQDLVRPCANQVQSGNRAGLEPARPDKTLAGHVPDYLNNRSGLVSNRAGLVPARPDISRTGPGLRSSSAGLVPARTDLSRTVSGSGYVPARTVSGSGLVPARSMSESGYQPDHANIPAVVRRVEEYSTARPAIVPAQWFRVRVRLMPSNVFRAGHGSA